MNCYKRFVVALSFLATVFGGQNGRPTRHFFHTLSSKRINSVASCCDVQSLFDNDVHNILKVRVPDTSSHKEVQEYIINRLRQLERSRWEITLDKFEANTPHGRKTFTNIIATLDPHISKRLVLSAHYDSKYDKKGKFLGATDSAVPVAMIIDLILTLDSKLQNRGHDDHSLQVIFFDGEEAFETWTKTDSLYGSRHLAEEMYKPNGLLSVDDKTGIEAIQYFVLLDLLGSKDPYPKIHNSYSSGEKAFEKLINIEERLDKAGLLEDHTSNYFVNGYFGFIEDDHIPFHQRGVPIVHVIPAPFPTVWHKVSDNLSAIDEKTVQNFKKIFMVFLYEYFNLK